MTAIAPEPDELPPRLHDVMRFYAELAEPGWVMPFQPIAAHYQLPRSSIKRSVRKLAKLGYLDLNTGFDEYTGLIAGRGYELTARGMAWCRAYRQAMEARTDA